jgi:hypothetical protein
MALKKKKKKKKKPLTSPLFNESVGEHQGNLSREGK